LHWQGQRFIGLVSNQRHDWRFHDQTLQGALFCKFRDRSWEWFLHRTQDQEKPKQRSTSQILKWSSVRNARNLNLVELRVQYIIKSHLRKKDGTTGVCWEKWHTWRMDVQRISHLWVETSPKCNKQVTSMQHTRFSLTSIN
jgi:hypothetical protein